MDDGSRLPWIIAIALLFCAAYFGVAETAFASASRNKIKTSAERGDPRARNALFVLDQFDRAVTTILIGTNIVHIAIASIVTVAVTRRWGLNAVSVSTILTTLVVFFAGEMLPKSIAKKYPERFSKACAASLRALMTLLYPFSAALTWIGRTAAGLTRGDPEISVTEDELYDIIEDMTEEGTLNEEQGDLISSAISFGDVTVESILTSRVDVAALDIGLPQEKILEVILGGNHSRLPVYEGSIDHIIGTLQIRRYMREYLHQREKTEIRPLLDEPYFVHQSTKIDDLLQAMSKEQLNMAVVTDNYGGTLGIVTVEDILEELVGEIWDEDDRVVSNIMALPDGAYSINPEEHVTDVLDELGVDYDEEEEERVRNKLMNELTFEHFPGIPAEGDSFRYLDLTVTVLRMKGNRILRLRAVKTPGGEA